MMAAVELRRIGAMAIVRLMLAACCGVMVFHVSSWVLHYTFLQQRFDDVLTRVSLKGQPAPDIMLIGIDQAAIDRFGSWPFPQEQLYQLAERLIEAEAKAVVFVDPVLRGEISIESVHALRKLSKRAPILIPRAVRVDPFDRYVVQLQRSENELIDRLQSGIALIEPSLDGVVREARLGYRVSEQQVEPQFALVAAGALRETLALPEVNPDRALRIHFSGPPRSRSAIDVGQLLSDQPSTTLVQGKICVIGLMEPSLIGSLTIPLSDPPLYASPVEIHASAIDTLLSGRYGPDLPWWVESLMAFVLCLGLVFSYRLLRPIGIMVLMLVYSLLLPAIALLTLQFAYVLLPSLSFVVMGVVTLLGSLILQLVRYQDDLLSLLTVLQKTHWLLPADVNRRALSESGMEDLAGSINELIHGEGTLIVKVVDKNLHTVAVSGLQAGEEVTIGTALQPIPVEEMAVIDGNLLNSSLQGRFWSVPIRSRDGLNGWLLVRLQDMTRIRQAEVMVQGLTGHLRQLVGASASSLQGRGALPDLKVLRFLRQHYLSDITERLESLQARDRNEREIITLMLDMTQVGLVLADSVGRVLFKNRFLEEVLADVALPWDGESAIGLIKAVADQQQSETERNIADCFRSGKGRTFTLSSKKENADSYMLQVWPFLHDPLDGDEQEVGFRSLTGASLGTIGRMPAWPDHFIVAVSNITAFKHVDRLKSELIEMISFKCRNHMSSILVCSDLLENQDSTVEEVIPELRRTATSLDHIFEQYRNTAHFSIDYQSVNQPVPLNVQRLVLETMTDLQELADGHGVVFAFEKHELLESGFVSEGPLRQAFGELLTACVHASRPKQVIDVTLNDADDGLHLEVMMPECTLLVALRRFPVSHLQGLNEYESLAAASAADDQDLSLQAAALMPEIHAGFDGVGVGFRVLEYQEGGLLFRLTIPVLS